MNTQSIKAAWSTFKHFTAVNSHTIKAVAAMVGVCAVAKTSYDAYPEVQDRIAAAEEEKGGDLTKLETVVAAAPAFVKPGLVLGVTELCMYDSNKDANGKIAALAGLAALKSDEVKEFKEKTEELLGKNKVAEIESELTKDHFNKSIGTKDEDGWNWPETIPDGKFWWRDALTGQVFRANHEDVALAVAQIDADLAFGEIVTLDELFFKLGIKDCDAGRIACWIPNTGYGEGVSRVEYHVNYVKGPNGEPAAELVLTNLSFR